MQQHDEDRIILSGKQKLMIAGGALVAVLAIIVSLVFMLNKNNNDNPDTSGDGANQFSSQVDNLDAPPVYEDERDGLDDSTTEDLIRTVEALAAQGKWGQIVESVSDYDKDYNIDESERGQYLKSLFFDANTLARLQEMGDTTEAVEEAKITLGNLTNPEMFVLGLYFLPRNVMLDLSADTLALAPTQRGNVEILNITHIPTTNEEGFANDEINQDETIKRYIGLPASIEFPEDFYRIDVNNGGFNEYVYLVRSISGPINLVGFYSDENGPEYTTKTVSHYQEFTKKIQAGFDQHFSEEETSINEQDSIDEEVNLEEPESE